MPPPKRKLIPMKQKPRKYVMLSPRRFMAAIKGSHGMLTRIAERAGVCYSTVEKIINKRHKYSLSEAWAPVHQAYIEECERVDDIAELAVVESMEQRKDIATAARTGLRYLTTRCRAAKRGFVDRTRMVHEGGERPIQINTTQFDVPIDKLDLPVEVRALILDKMEEYQKSLAAISPVIKVEGAEYDDEAEGDDDTDGD